jgi:MFS family permease
MAVGVGEATLHPSALSMLADYFSGPKLARANSIYLLAGYIGSGFALFVGGAAIQFLSVSHTPLLLLFDSLAIWQKTFVLVGASGFILLIPLAFVREPARLNPGSHGHVEQLQVNKTGLLQHLRAHTLLYSCIYIAFPLVSLIGYGTVAWMPTYFARVYHWSLHDIGYVYGLIVAFSGALGLLAGGRLLGWVEDRGYGDSPFRVSAWAITLAAVFFISAMFTSEFHVVLGLVALGHFFLAMPIAPGFTALQTITPNRLRAQVVAIHFCIATPIGPAFGPVLIGAFTEYLFANDLAVGHSIALAWILVAPIIVGAMWLGMGSYRKKIIAQLHPENSNTGTPSLK